MTDPQEERRRAEQMAGGLHTRPGGRRRVVINDRSTPAPRKRTMAGLQQELRREVDARRLQGEGRLSKEDEQRMTDEIRAREAAEARRRARADNEELLALTEEACAAAKRLIDKIRSMGPLGDRTRKDYQEVRKRLRRMHSEHTLPE